MQGEEDGKAREQTDSNPLTASDLLFPLASTNFNSIVRSLRKPDVPIQVRLKSIVKDSQVVRNVADRLQLPIIANERCGSWYVPPEIKAGSAYFKVCSSRSLIIVQDACLELIRT